MSIRSMTGFGRGTARRDGLRIDVEISTVNRRQLDVQIHLPKELQSLESRLQTEIGRSILRGRVTVSVKVAVTDGAGPRIRVRTEAARAYVEAWRRLARSLHMSDRIDLAMLAAIPDLWVVEHPEQDAEAIWPTLLRALRQALRSVGAMRAAEGAALARDLRARFAAIGRRLVAIRRAAPLAAERHRTRLRRCVEDLCCAAHVTRDQLLREIVTAAERMDISEELTRLDSHLAQARAMLRQAGPIGRSLDFLAQEMLREAHTISAKCCDGHIAEEIVEFKSELERIREQIQNIE
ncbi:MAG: YicC family protein [Kiritimatiellae bacterium]|nr:YicC family protein [Kiritimatiellia bacterium]